MNLRRHNLVIFGLIILLTILGLFAYFESRAGLLHKDKQTKLSQISEEVSSRQIEINELRRKNEGNPEGVDAGSRRATSLASNIVTFRLPKKWQISTDESFNHICTGGSRFSNLMCLDTKTLTPDSLEESSTFSVDISVFTRSDESLPILDWVEQEYDLGLSTSIEPAYYDRREFKVNSKPAFSVIKRYTDTVFPSVYYGFILGEDYAVIVKSEFMKSSYDTGGILQESDYSLFLSDIEKITSSVVINE